MLPACARRNARQDERLRSGAHAIVTGHQASLFGGPLFSLLKAISIAKIAAETTARGIPTVPIFWLATEDHDVAEVSSVTLLAKPELRTLVAATSAILDTPVSAVKFDENISDVVAEATALLGDSEIPDLLKQFYVPGATFGGALAKLFARIFSDYGIIFLDAADPELHALAKPLCRAAVEHSAELTKSLLDRSKQLEAAGYHAQVKVTLTSTVLFRLAEATGARQPIHLAHNIFSTGSESNNAQTFSRRELLGLIDAHPEQFSANVLMRPVVQDFLLPTLAYVGGPAEVAYFAQAAVVYKNLLGRVTPILPRLSATLVEPPVAFKLDKYKLALPDFFLGVEHVRKLLAKAVLPETLSKQFERAKSELLASLQRVTESLEKLDPTLVDAARNAQSKMLYQLDTLAARSAAAELRRHADIARGAEFLSNALYPNKDLQEREIAVTYFLARHGTALLKNLYDSAAINCPDHQIFYL